MEKYWLFKKGHKMYDHKKGCRCFRCDRENFVYTKESREKSRLANAGQVRPSMRGGNHPRWKGDSVKYESLHDWIQVQKGKAIKCEHCGSSGGKIRGCHWANKSGNYLRDLDDWISLCAKCHSKYDRSNGLIGKRTEKFGVILK